MEVTRKLTELDPADLSVVERLMGQPLDHTTNLVLVLRTVDVPPVVALEQPDELPAWCNVLEGMSDEELAAFRATLAVPVHLARNA